MIAMRRVMPSYALQHGAGSCTGSVSVICACLSPAAAAAAAAEAVRLGGLPQVLQFNNLTSRQAARVSL